MRSGVQTLALLASIILIPTAVYAQAVIAGSVRDTSGAVLPGVTVEASSPALIEKVRTSTSDSSGQYRIEDLRPGVYKVTFTLPGFATFEREGVELTGSFTASINAEMRVGSLEETVTVTGESPIVDVQSARRQTVLNNDVLRAIPTVRSYNALVVVVPGVVTNTNDVATGTATTQFPDSRRPQQRGPHDDRRPQRRQSPRRQPAARLLRGRGQLRGDLLHHLRRPRRVRDSRPGDEHRAQDGRQRPSRVRVLQRQRREAAGRQHRGYGPGRAGTAVENLRPQRRSRRADRQGQALVLRHRAHTGQHPREREHVLQPERRRSDQVAVSRRSRRQRSRLLRSHLGEHQRASDLAGHAQDQDRRLLGRAVGVSQLPGRDYRHHHAAGGVARGDRSRPDAAAARAAGDVDVAAHQPAAVRCRLRRHLLRLGQLRARRQ